MELIPSDRPMATDLILEVDLTQAVVGAEEDEVARRLKAIETPELMRQHVRRVEPL